LNRREYIQKSSLALLGLSFPSSYTSTTDIIIGHGDFRYKVDLTWGDQNPSFYPVTDCHEMVEDSKGRLILLTNNVKNNILIYDKKGQILDSWTINYNGAHGLTLKNEGGEDFLYITDSELGLVSKHTLSGRTIWTIKSPFEAEISEINESFRPTETAVLESSGNVYISDGYGSQLVFVYDQNAKLVDTFGGRGPEEDKFYNCHGVAIDTRSGDEKILVTARDKNELKYFTAQGDFLSTVKLPGAYICRPVIDDDNIYLATIWSGDKSANSGFVSILDKKNRLVSAPGGIAPLYKEEGLRTMNQLYKIFRHPHDVCVDGDKNLYIPQWSAGASYPIKLTRV